MKVKDGMTKQVICCTPRDTAEKVARIMKAGDVGAVPVVSDLKTRQLEGIVTDRDLCCRVMAPGKASASVSIRKAMTHKPVTCGPDDLLDDCEKLMQKHRIRRVPVVDKKGRCIGIVAQGDIARHAPAAKVRQTIAEISRPWRVKHPSRAAA
jgi:CBS domain-containing protein